jgi:Ca2+-transporting ATPase
MKGLRTLVLAFKEMPKGTHLMEEIQTTAGLGPLDNDLTFLALIAIEDPLREGVAEAVQDCKAAGVKVCMVTGDNLLTGSPQPFLHFFFLALIQN